MQAARSMTEVHGSESKSDKTPNSKVCNIKLFPAWSYYNSEPVHKFVITDCRGPEEHVWKQDATCFQCGRLFYELPPTD